MQLAYLYSRYPVISQTFCDMEMLEMERRGYDLLIGAVHAPLTTLRHEHFARFRSPVQYAPPSAVMALWEQKTRQAGRWPEELIKRHDHQYGASFKASLRARNATYFAALFARHGIRHFHVHFANRAAHTALFLKEISGIPFSITAHGQDFMSDLGQDDLLREICRAAEFVAVETDYSRGLLQERCPESSNKVHRVYNGLDLANLPSPSSEERAPGPLTIVSVGRLVAFKGFEFLLAACAELKTRHLNFQCQIVGDGPLRGKLETMIADLDLNDRVELCGSLSQDEVYAKLRACDIFALASVIDAEGASDVFPTVIMEAMTCARPVVSTTVAGIPESVVDGVTGYLVPPNDSAALADALAKLGEADLRARFGAAGRARMTCEFNVAKTIEPLQRLFEKCLERSPIAAASEASKPSPAHIAYLIERWPDKTLPSLETELRSLAQNKVPYLGFVLHPPDGSELKAKTDDLVTQFEYLPDAMVIEAEYQANLPLRLQLETMRAEQKHRPPSNLFLEQARYALILRRLFRQHNIRHVHATSSRTLLSALMLKKLLNVTVSAALETKPVLSESVITEALRQVVGERRHDRRRPGRDFWHEWSQQLLGWTRPA
ncbi:MAG: glycosyltransferase [Chthoniobacterales bacterium]